MNNKTLKYFSPTHNFSFWCSKSIEKSPNIVFILTDDLAYADLSSYGSEFIETPNLDKMAEDGLNDFILCSSSCLFSFTSSNFNWMLSK